MNYYLISKNRKTLHKVRFIFSNYDSTNCGIGAGVLYGNENDYEFVSDVNPLTYAGPVCKVCFR